MTSKYRYPLPVAEITEMIRNNLKTLVVGTHLIVHQVCFFYLPGMVLCIIACFFITVFWGLILVCWFWGGGGGGLFFLVLFFFIHFTVIFVLDHMFALFSDHSVPLLWCSPCYSQLGTNIHKQGKCASHREQLIEFFFLLFLDYFLWAP